MHPPRGVASLGWVRAVRSERGSGTVLGLALFCMILLCASVSIPSALSLETRAEVRALADSVALSGARVLAGLASGDPCDAARRVAEANGVTLSGCRVGEADLRVTVTRQVAGVTVRSVAFAGFLTDDTRD
ncbi:hypothetical protein D9V34_17015 [Mycetocola lacteus]|uniref:Helicase/secretion neighborhood TadE-like protein n=1 Tax=Mycetocola lacteus TaxID=76637 RepID=A0A3L7AG02_9MICO|nr:hypothetical protein D9V34_17015 [Mycetocola lacteus]